MRLDFQTIVIASTAAMGLGVGGCVVDTPLVVGDIASSSRTQSEELAPAPVPSKLPWQLTPSSTASAAQGERTINVADTRYGRVKGTSIAVANLDKPLIAFAPRGPIVTACKRIIEPQAKSIGAYSVQAAAAGPIKMNAEGDRTQQIFFRIIYDRFDYLEVRQSSLVCRADKTGKIIDAKPV